MLEQGTRDVLIEAGVGERLQREGIVHGGIYLQLDAERTHIPMRADGPRGDDLRPDGGRQGSDRRAARTGAPADIRGEGRRGSMVWSGDRPMVRYRHGGVERELRARLHRRLRRLPRRQPPDDSQPGTSRSGSASTRSPGSGSSPQVAPSTDELIYARNERGFALHSMRSHDGQPPLPAGRPRR